MPGQAVRADNGHGLGRQSTTVAGRPEPTPAVGMFTAGCLGYSIRGGCSCRRGRPPEGRPRNRGDRGRRERQAPGARPKLDGVTWSGYAYRDRHRSPVRARTRRSPATAPASRASGTLHSDTSHRTCHVAQADGGEPVLLLYGWPQHWYAGAAARSAVHALVGQLARQNPRWGYRPIQGGCWVWGTAWARRRAAGSWLPPGQGRHERAQGVRSPSGGH
jgi:hypothetical protein